ncbi:MMPL family transporter [Paenibacillus athensensis]|uniref:Membrane transport protein MMPL domain-containing protein n=1 Tax=Paenibacillus athensensis TaxID=1967502 RepID=A0A4Y8PW80_9BACL|nr:MMPL family transporter [Paenibacillus athensensis]MCD1260610.1 MMPL family transporter [Paenibacillus athensensis]
MQAIVKWRWLVLVLWLAAVVGLVLGAPNMEALVRDKGQITVPDGYPSTVAGKLMKEMNGETSAGADESSVLVFHNDKGLTGADKDEIKRGLELLKQAKDSAGVNAVTSPFDSKELEAQMASKDGTTMIALVRNTLDGRTPGEASKALYDTLSDVKVEHYFTGNWLINEDVVASSQEGLKKTEWITVVFIMAILFVVFRSVIAPFIPLLTVGISYVAAQSVVAFLAEYLNFPVSNFTQIFMVAVMFGIGTDYCILLISRFKEELGHGADNTSAILTAYRTAGRTVFFSALAVLVGFVSIGFSTFSLYRSAVAVAVGVAVLMVALSTLVPFFLAVLGKAIFWPAKGSLEHKQSGLWGALGRFSLKRPLVALLVLAAVVVPFLTMYKGAISFNSLDEIGDKYKSVKAFQLISDSFGPGESLSTGIVIKSDKPLDTQEALGQLEQISRELSKVDGVKTVRGVSRPTGEQLTDFQVAKQVDTLGDGLNKGEDGLGQISKGLSEASSQLSGNAPKLNEAAGGAAKLVDGTNQLKAGVVQLGNGLTQLQKGLEDGSVGAAGLQTGLKQLQESADKLAAANTELLGHYKELGSGLGQLSQAYASTSAQSTELAKGLADLGQGMSALALSHPELQQDAQFVKAQGAVDALSKGAAALDAGLRQLNGQLAGISAGLTQANAGFEQASGGQQALGAGLASVADGLAKLQAGIAQAAAGQGQIVGKLPDLTKGFDSLADGQKSLQTGFEQLGGQLSQLTGGLDQSVSGLNELSGGLQSAQTYLQQLSAAPDKELTGWFVPDEALTNADFQKALDAYMSKDRKMVKFDVVFNGNPYDLDTIGKIDDLNAAVKRALKGTQLEGATYAIDGVTSANNDLQHISHDDYSRTTILMLIGIALILIIMFRSLVIPLYLILSLILTYYTALAVTEFIYVRIFDMSGISWSVPFFGFVLLMALGIDYSIFLMDRFKEYRHMPPQEGILLAMKNMGTVIISAAVILGGTFAAMLPSGVMSLLQIATIVLAGLVLYALFFLPLFIPVMVRMFDVANWWPFMGRKETPRGSDRSIGGHNEHL